MSNSCPRFRISAAIACLSLGALAGCGSSSIPVATGTLNGQFYVSAQAPSGGDGSRASPFNTLAALQQASAPGDTLVVLPSPLAVAPLDGGIALQPGQKLLGEQVPAGSTPEAARITNSSGTLNAGDAVDLAPDAEVAGLVIVNTYRSGIYGMNTPGVNIHDNDVSGQNTRCAQGLVIPGDVLPTIVPGVTIPFPVPLPNGWAGIMVDANQGTGTITIRNNRVHDAACGDGIDLRLFNAAVYRADIDGNTVYNLKQPDAQSGILSVLAIGMQTNNGSNLTAAINNNTEHDIGSSILSPEGADSEGVFPNVVDTSTLTASIDNNNFYHGIGGFSANGLEIPVMGDGGTAIVHVSNSTFTDVPADIIELFALGTNGHLQLTLDNVTASYSTGGSLQESVVGSLGGANDGDCLVVASTGGGGNSLSLKINNSRLTNCYHNGLTFISNSSVLNAVPTQSIDFDIENSQISDSRGDGLSVLDLSPLTQLTGKVQNTNFSGNQGVNINLDQQSSQPPVLSLDFGGGAQGSAGGNCILNGGKGAVTTSGFSADFQNNWWGSPAGPAAGTTTAQNGTLDIFPVLGAAPAACPPPAAAQ